MVYCVGAMSIKSTVLLRSFRGITIKQNNLWLFWPCQMLFAIHAIYHVGTTSTDHEAISVQAPPSAVSISCSLFRVPKICASPMDCAFDLALFAIPFKIICGVNISPKVKLGVLSIYIIAAL